MLSSEAGDHHGPASTGQSIHVRVGVGAIESTGLVTRFGLGLSAGDKDFPVRVRLLTQTELRHAQDATLNTDALASDVAPLAGLPTDPSSKGR